jgi:hypothetical protein
MAAAMISKHWFVAAGDQKLFGWLLAKCKQYFTSGFYRWANIIVLCCLTGWLLTNVGKHWLAAAYW